jgi:hypothetical protein
MKRYVLGIALVSMLLSTATFSQEPEFIEEMEQKMHMRKMELEMAEYETEVKFNEEMRKLELEQRRNHLERERRAFDHRDHRENKMGPILIVVCFIIHILTAIWVYTDIRRRNSGSGIWIVIALLAGLFGVLAYALVRLGDINNNRRARR